MKSIARAILVGGLIVTTQAAVADGSQFPTGSDQYRYEPAVGTKYKAEHAGGQPAARNDSFPGGPSEEPWQLLPGQAAYFDRKAERAATSAPHNPGSNAD